MFKRILVPVDGSDQSLQAVRIAVSIGSQYGSKVHLLHVITPPTGNTPGPDVPPTFMNIALKQWEKMGRTVLEKAYQECQADHVTISVELDWGTPARVICDKAREGNYDLIVIGSRGLGSLTGLILGSVSDRVSHLAPCPVLIARQKGPVKTKEA